MKKWKTRLIVLLAVLCLLLSGCEIPVPASIKQMFSGNIRVKFSEMEYSRPDIDALEQALENAMVCAQGDDFSALEDALIDYSNRIRSFSTNYALATIYYYTDMTDIYWTDEYNACLEMTTQADAGLDSLMYALADSPFREQLETEEYYGEGYFDDYEGESIWDETFSGLMEEESDILSEYYALAAQGNTLTQEQYYGDYATEMCEIYVRLVAQRQKIAAYAGYDSYPEFAYDFTYAREYTPKQVEEYLQQVRTELVPLYCDIMTNGLSDVYLIYRTQAQTFSYVEKMADAMGGIVWEAFEQMQSCELYDISYSENKYDASFEIYLSSYAQPYVFLNPEGTDRDDLTFAHEFGHFCNDYASWGSEANVDVAETFSQGMEYLSLFYAEDTEMLEKIKMVDSLCIYVEQSAFADFEHRVYALDAEELTTDRVFSLYEQINADYGFDLYGATGRDFISVVHFFMSPCYVFSYVVSNDVAMQYYQMEVQQAGSGLEMYTAELSTEAISLEELIEEANLESPFAQGRVQSVRETFERILK